MIHQNLSLSLLIFSLHFFFQTCHANSNCTPSSCGIIHDITSPFRLNNHPKNCGRFELACENDVASIVLDSQRYYVKEINYLNHTIRLADPSINNHYTCSFPNSSIFYEYPYPYYPAKSSRPIYFMSCSNPLKNSSLFTDVSAECAYNHSSRKRYAYIKIGRIKASHVANTCSVDVIAKTSWRFEDSNNVSISEIHDSLLYGFEVNFCGECKELRTQWEKYRNLFLGFLPILGAVVGVNSFHVSLAVITCAAFFFIAGLSFPLIIIVGLGFLSFFLFQLILVNATGVDLIILEICGFLITAPKFIICPFVVWFLIYKFRNRHLSVYEAIECFLQSDNKLAPIRYSYSDVRKMTRSFEDKLGQGGYGSIYKGKLRSGHEVAVKLLKESGGNGQDFMNEIGTIGRIHHVNVVKLVGYCAQGSKRALVFDFMPNGSLEKYLSNGEKANSLSWDVKFEVAVGVARGIGYLHRGCDVQILHFDIKPHNILLDANFVPKISDFGLAKFCSTDKNGVTMTAARGTIGYVAPELISRSIGPVSYKADVYSFGMLLVEMVGLKRDLTRDDDVSSKYFPCWIYDCLNQDKDIQVGNGDENEDDDDDTRKLVRKMTIVALWCIQMSPDDRPSMNKVLEMLEVDAECLQIPEYPSRSTHIVVDVDETCSTGSSSLQS